MAYSLPSSFQGGIMGAVDSLKKGTLPQLKTSPVIKPTEVKQTFTPPKPLPVDPNKTPEAFKKRFIEKHGDGTAEDGRKYSQIPANEIVVKVIRKYGDGKTTDGIPYRDFLPRGSEGDSLEYRLKQIESLSTMPQSQYATTGTIRGATAEENKFASDVTKRKNEGEISKTIKAPIRGLQSVGQNLAYGTWGVAADVADVFDGQDKNSVSNRMRKVAEQEQFKSGQLNQNKGFVEGMQQGDLSSVVQSLSEGAGYMATAAKIPLFLMALSQGGNMSLEGEQQGQGGFVDKAIGYGTGAISSTIDRISSKNVLDGLMKTGVKKQTATTFVNKMNNYLKGLKPSDLEAGTEVIQQKIENIGRDLMGVKYEEGLKQYFEAGLMGKILGKVGDKGRSQATVTTMPPAPPKPPKYVNNNLNVIQGIRTGVKGTDTVSNAKARGFDPETDVATYKELAPVIDKDGRVNTDDAQVNLKKHIDPMQEQVSQLIKGENKSIPIQEAIDVMSKNIEQELGTGLNYEAAMSRLEVAKRTLQRNATNGMVGLDVLDTMKKTIYQETDYTKDNDKADKAIARALKEAIENNVTTANIKELNNELARWYTTREYLKLLGTGTKTVKGGRLGGYTASLSGRIVGGIIGSMGGPVVGALGSVVGGEVAGKVRSSILQNLLKKGEGKLPKSKKFSDAEKAQQNKKANMLLPPPSGKPTSANVVDVQPMTGYAPGVLEKTSSAIGTMPSDSSTQKSKLPITKILEGKGQGSASKDIKNSTIISKIAKKQETPKLPTRNNNTEIGITQRATLKINSLMDDLGDKAKMSDGTAKELRKALEEGKITLSEAKKIRELREQKWMHNSAFEKMNNTGTKTELKAKPEWDLVIRDFETPKLPVKTEVKYTKKDIANKKYNPTEIYKDYTENYMHSDKWKGKSKAIIIDSDAIKGMFKEYDPKNPGIVHEESSKLSKEFFDRAVKENPDSPVIFTAGGPASGKSEGVVNQYHGDKNIIFDTVLGDFEGFLRKAKSKIDGGNVKVHAIYTDIDTAKIYNLKRKRSVPEELLIEKHRGFRKAMSDLINSKEYKEGKISVEIKVNNGGEVKSVPISKIKDFILNNKDRLDIK